ncbi:MAG: hypothetical protein KAH20_08855 [Methylococcales bacterium]|nr:hypothetical protein [Methylococcales bacterium]
MNTTPPSSENVVVVKDEQSGLKGIQGVKDTKGKIEFPIALSSGDFELTVETNLKGNSTDLSFFLQQLRIIYLLNLAKLALL